MDGEKRVKYNDLKSRKEKVWGSAGLRGAQLNHNRKHRSSEFNTRVKTCTFNQHTWCQRKPTGVSKAGVSFFYIQSMCNTTQRNFYFLWTKINIVRNKGSSPVRASVRRGAGLHGASGLI